MSSKNEEEKSGKMLSKKYWEKIPATVDGMLGGFSEISSQDINGSRRFLLPYIQGKKAKTGNSQALDCGAGIGRISKHLLCPLFEKVDMLDQSQSFLNEAKNYIGENRQKVDRYICSGLQDFIPEDGRYNLIWIQWVISYLSDQEFVDIFTRLKNGLVKGGLIVLKENLTESKAPDVDDEDCTVTRPGKQVRELIRRCGYKICKEERQNNFPRELYEVRMFACQVNDRS